MGVGPAVIGLITDYVFGDPQKLGLAIATMIAVVAPIGIILAAFAIKPIREKLATLA
jgi:hypothetical protein